MKKMIYEVWLKKPLVGFATMGFMGFFWGMSYGEMKLSYSVHILAGISGLVLYTILMYPIQMFFNWWDSKTARIFGTKRSG